ncbi:hypothetical protein REPUB_Repub05bG0019100 [Reevesia pubescens]
MVFNNTIHILFLPYFIKDPKGFPKAPLTFPSPLSPPPPELPIFILTACSPFKIKQASPKTKNNGESPSKEDDSKAPSLILEAANKATLLFLLVVAAIPAQIILGVEVELEPQFNAPLLATSLQDFWGHRWNLRVSDTLRPTIYNPLRSISTRIIGPRWASLPAVFATFVTSGLMHELIYYHIIRKNPTWEVTWFFVLQGIFVDIEIILKKKLVETKKFRLHKAISGPLALANIAVTAGWLSYTQLLRNGIDDKLIEEFNMFLEFLKGSA